MTTNNANATTYKNTVMVYEDSAGGYDLFVFDDNNEQIYAHHYYGDDISHRDAETACGGDLRMMIAAINRRDTKFFRRLEGDESDILTQIETAEWEAQNNGAVKLMYSTERGWEDDMERSLVYAHATASVWVRYNQTEHKIEDWVEIPNYAHYDPRFEDIPNYHHLVTEWLIQDGENEDDHGYWDGDTDDYTCIRDNGHVIILAEAARYAEEYGGDVYIPTGYWSEIVEDMYDPMDTLQKFPRWCITASAVRISDSVQGKLCCEQYDPDYADDEDVFFAED